MKISGPISYHKLKINNNIFIHLFADAHEGDHKYNCKELYNEEDYTISDFLLNIYQNTNNISFYFEGNPLPNLPADDFNDFLTDAIKEFRKDTNIIKTTINSSNNISFTDLRENISLLEYNIETNKYRSKIGQLSYITDTLQYSANKNFIFSIFASYKYNINILFEITTPLIQNIRPYWNSIINDKNKFNENIDNFLKEQTVELFENIKAQFKLLHCNAVDFLTCDNIINEINNGRNNFILYFGYCHIDNIIKMLKTIYSEFSFNIIGTQDKKSNRCLDLKITNFNDLLSNSLNTNNIIGGRKPKKNKVNMPITKYSKAEMQRITTELKNYVNPNRLTDRQKGSRL